MRSGLWVMNLLPEEGKLFPDFFRVFEGFVVRDELFHVLEHCGRKFSPGFYDVSGSSLLSPFKLENFVGISSIFSLNVNDAFPEEHVGGLFHHLRIYPVLIGDAFNSVSEKLLQSLYTAFYSLKVHKEHFNVHFWTGGESWLRR